MDSAGLTIKLKIKEHGKEIASFTHFSNTHDHKVAYACAFSEFIGSKTFKQLNYALGGEFTIETSFLVNTVMPGTASKKELVLSFAQKYFVEHVMGSFLVKIGKFSSELENGENVLFYYLATTEDGQKVNAYEIHCKKQAELYLFSLTYETGSETKTLCTSSDMRSIITTLLFLAEMAEAES